MRPWVWLLLVLGPVDAGAQQGAYIVGNTLIPGTPYLVAMGKSHGPGRSGGAPAPARAPTIAAPSPDPQPGGEIGRGEGSFQFVPHGSVIIPPVVQSPVTPVSMPQAAPCPDCGMERILTVPVQLHLRAATQIGAVQTQAIAPRGSCP